MSPYEQYISHLRTWLTKYHLKFAEIETMPLETLFDLEVVDSKIEAAFEERRSKAPKKTKNNRKKRLEDFI